MEVLREQGDGDRPPAPPAVRYRRDGVSPI